MTTPTILAVCLAVLCLALTEARDTTHHLTATAPTATLSDEQRSRMMRMSHRASSEHRPTVRASHASLVADVDDDLAHNGAVQLDASEARGRREQKARRRSRLGSRGHPERVSKQRKDRREMVHKYAKAMAKKAAAHGGQSS